MLQKYSSLNAVITLNYPKDDCKGQYPTLDITVFDPCMPVTYDTDGETVAGSMTLTFNDVGARQQLWNTTAGCSSSSIPTMDYNRTYKDMKYGECKDTDDTEDNYKYNILKTHFLMH